MDGFIALDKPAGISSAAAVNAVKRLLPRGTRIGHAGTLDPFATGLLILLIGKGTKRCEELMNHPKRYEATIQLGATTETDDPESTPCPTPGAIAPPESMLQAALKQFVGDILQTPPAYSAIKLSGRRACDRVRDGETVQLRARLVRVDEIVLFNYGWPQAKVRIDCGRGTYIRAIARDVGKALRVGGYLSDLRRTRTGRFDVANAATIEMLQTDGVERHLIGLD